MAIYQTARFKVRPEALEECRQAIQEFVEYIRLNEPDTLSYTSVVEAEDEASFVHFFAFKDEAAREKHRTSDGVNRFVAVLYPNTVAGVDFTEYELVATK